MYFPDLSPYTYFPTNEINLLNVGWLDAAEPYPAAKATGQFLIALFSCCISLVQLTRGFHVCPFCQIQQRWGIREVLGGKVVKAGSGEIRVSGSNGIVYAAPDLVYHYVREHEYDPPDEFKVAVKNNPVSRSP